MKNIKDNQSLKDELLINGKKVTEKLRTGKGFRTSISAYDDYGNVLFKGGENQTVLGGALFTALKIADVRLNWNVATFNEITGINNNGITLTEEDFNNTYICLFGCGIGGSGEVPGTIRTVKFQQREMDNMIPFRITDEPLNKVDQERYWLREPLSEGFVAYYLKSIDNKAVKVLWRDGSYDEEGSAVPPNVYQTTRKEPIETFIDFRLRVDKHDFREYFNITGDIENAYINQVGLWTGVKKTDPKTGKEDYVNTTMFSLYNFKNEELHLDKSINFSYRIYIV